MGLVILLFAAPVLVSPLFAIEAAWRLISRQSAKLRGSVIALATFIFATSIGVFVPLLQAHFGRNENYLAFTFAVLQFAIGYFVLAIVFRLLARDTSELLGPAAGLFSAAFVFPIIFLIFGNELLLRFGISLHS